MIERSGGRDISSLPNTFVIGAPKAASTTLCSLLGEHPDVFMSTPKEVGFFASDSLYSRGLEWYLSFFENAGRGDQRIIAEGSTNYSKLGEYPLTVRRMKGHLRDPRFIYIVRHPIRRLESHYLQRVHNGHWNDSISGLLEKNEGFLLTSNYLTHLKQYEEAFSAESILVLFFEEFVKDPIPELKKCFRFLDIDLDFEPANAGVQLNSRDDHLRDRTLARFARHLPAYDLAIQAASRYLPPSIRRLGKRVLRRPLERSVLWDKPTLRRVVEYLEEDTRIFLRRMGKPPDYWDLSIG